MKSIQVFIVCLLGLTILFSCGGQDRIFPGDEPLIPNPDKPDTTTVIPNESVPAPEWLVPGVRKLYDITKTTKSNLPHYHYARIEKTGEVEYSLVLGSGEFDLSSVEGNPVGGMIPVSGPVFGERETRMPLSITLKGDYPNNPFAEQNFRYAFSAKVRTDKVDFECSGEIFEDSIHLVVDSERLLSNPLPDGVTEQNKWDPWYPNNNIYFDEIEERRNPSPFIINWQTSATLPATLKGESASELLQAIFMARFMDSSVYGFGVRDKSLYLSPVVIFNRIFFNVNIEGNEVEIRGLCMTKEDHPESPPSYFSKYFSPFPAGTFRILPTQADRLRLFINPVSMMDVQIAESHYYCGGGALWITITFVHRYMAFFPISCWPSRLKSQMA